MLKLSSTILITALLLTGCAIEDQLSDDDQPIINPSVDPNDTLVDAVKRHNEIRASIFVGSQLIWNEGIAASAENYAIHLAYKGDLIHDSDTEYGENLYASTHAAGYVEAINTWYSEKDNYNYAENSCEGECSHYTQIVWKETTEVGCAKATYVNGEFKGGTVVVCRYNPPGNYIGEKPY